MEKQQLNTSTFSAMKQSGTYHPIDKCCVVVGVRRFIFVVVYFLPYRFHQKHDGYNYSSKIANENSKEGIAKVKRTTATY